MMNKFMKAVSPLKEDNISKEEITEKSPEVGIKASPIQLVETSFHKDKEKQQGNKEKGKVIYVQEVTDFA